MLARNSTGSNFLVERRHGSKFKAKETFCSSSGTAFYHKTMFWSTQVWPHTVMDIWDTQSSVLGVWDVVASQLSVVKRPPLLTFICWMRPFCRWAVELFLGVPRPRTNLVSYSRELMVAIVAWKQQTYFEHEFLIVFSGNFKVLTWTWPFLNRLLMWSSDLCHPRILVTRSEAESEKNHRWWTGVSTLQVWMKMNEKVWTRLEEHEKR